MGDVVCAFLIWSRSGFVMMYVCNDFQQVNNPGGVSIKDALSSEYLNRLANVVEYV